MNTVTPLKRIMLEEAQRGRIHTKPEILNQECIFCWLTNTLKVEDTFFNLLIYDVSVYTSRLYGLWEFGLFDFSPYSNTDG